MCTPDFDTMGSLSCPTASAKLQSQHGTSSSALLDASHVNNTRSQHHTYLACSNSGCILPRPNGPRSPPRDALLHSRMQEEDTQPGERDHHRTTQTAAHPNIRAKMCKDRISVNHPTHLQSLSLVAYLANTSVNGCLPSAASLTIRSRKSDAVVKAIQTNSQK